VKQFLSNLVSDENEFDRLLRDERGIRQRIRDISAGERLPRDVADALEIKAIASPSYWELSHRCRGARAGMQRDVIRRHGAGQKIGGGAIVNPFR